MTARTESSTQFADAVVIGAGVVGLAIARALACAGRDTLVIERNRLPGQETTSRNSGVIHSGIYYPAGSLKARLCVRGRELLSAAEVRELEPGIRCAAALWSPSTGIVDVPEFVQLLQADLERHSGAVAFGTEFLRAVPVASGFRLTVNTAGDVDEIECALLVNCGGLSAVGNLGRIAEFPASARVEAHLAKGNYFSLSGEQPFGRLIYPMPNQAGLGIHATLNLAGVKGSRTDPGLRGNTP